ncbi:F-box protein At5g03100 [Spinacia oleracea]|uniref:F-box protein At5g03100 n=1 Tax=Spinacia oleracea TaxID=3562 RepID=A0ABM3R0D0_SPIOL|nr:F-box protein At5g03100-like [Spinacia oleracea]
MAKEAKKMCNDLDRISNLPDCLLHRILSNLDTKLIVKSSFLSTRWKHIWAQTPFLNFRFHMDPFYELSFPCLQVQVSIFLDFVEQVLHRREPNKLFKFEFILPNVGIDPKVMESILSYVMNLKPEEVTFQVETYNSISMELPECFYVNESLEKLQLTASWVTFSNPNGFLTLKELRLHDLNENGRKSGDSSHYCSKRIIFCPDFFSKCPVLEVLSFSDCDLSTSVLTVSSPTLKKLEIVNSLFSKLVVSSPLLVYFKYEGAEPMNLYMNGDHRMLEEIDIDVKSYCQRYGSKNLFDMLRQVESARYVSVSMDTVKALAADGRRIENEPSLFPNLKNLNVKTDWTVNESGLKFLLSNSASDVETLIEVPKSLRSRLETFTII